MIFYQSGNPKLARNAPELIMRGPAVMLTYWQRSEWTRKIQERRFKRHAEKRREGK